MMMSSETSWPESITFFAATPSGVPAFTAARSMSPVEICGMPNFSLMTLACVPLPAPGGPSKMRRMVGRPSSRLFCLPSSGEHSTHGLEVLRRVHAGRDVAFADCDRDAVAMPQHAQLLQGLGPLDLTRLQAGELGEEPGAVGVEPRVPVARRLAFPRIGN